MPAMGRPIVLGVEGESRELIEEGGCGLCIEPEGGHKVAIRGVKQEFRKFLVKKADYSK